MRARDHTRLMLDGWAHSVDRADLAVRRASGTMIWVRDKEFARLPLRWARSENARGAEIYIRPARGYDWPMVFLDDVPVHIARRAAARYAALVVETSHAGGCHLWLSTSIDLDESQRHQCQRHLAKLAGADLASTSGEHLGRLAGFRNHKRLGPWVNVLAEVDKQHPPWTPPDLLLTKSTASTASTASADPRVTPRSHSGIDRSHSGRDWAWACRRLEDGDSPDLVASLLTRRCRHHRGRDAERYAERTVDRATRHLSR